MSLCEKCVRNESKAMRALESLTPSGSEFVDDVERCVQFIRDNRDSIQRYIVKVTKENRKLRTEIESLRRDYDEREAGENI